MRQYLLSFYSYFRFQNRLGANSISVKTDEIVEVKKGR